jgi:hypothetical protein
MLHEELATLSLAVEWRGVGGRVRDLSGSGRTASLGRVGSSIGERVDGVLVWKQNVPGMDACVVLIGDDKGTSHRCVMRSDGKGLGTGERVSLEMGAKATLTRQPGHSRGMRL